MPVSWKATQVYGKKGTYLFPGSSIFALYLPTAILLIPWGLKLRIFRQKSNSWVFCATSPKFRGCDLQDFRWYPLDYLEKMTGQDISNLPHLSGVRGEITFGKPLMDGKVHFLIPQRFRELHTM
jgi:hypothetical protein